MHVDATEKKWVYISTLMALVLVGVLSFYAVGMAYHPPSNVENIDSHRLHLTEEFAEDNLGVKPNADGGVDVRMVAARYGFYPQEIEVPVGVPVNFRIASFDVLHGIHVHGTNLTTMVVPGYVSEVNTTFQKTGDYTIFCNEYCGLAHDEMWSRLRIVEASGE